jgi:flagellin
MYVNQTNKDMADTMARLSSGKRINTAADDAAGVAIASRLSSEIRGTNQAIRNAQDGQALIDTAEGAHLEIENILQRMRELAVQSANDTNGASDRANLQIEMDQLTTEIDRIAGVTTWAGQNLLDGASPDTNNLSSSNADRAAFTFQVGTNTSGLDTITANIGAISSGALGLSGAASAPEVQSTVTAAGTAGTLEIKSGATDLTSTFVFDGTFQAGDTYSANLNGVAVSITAVDSDGYSNDMEGLARQFADAVVAAVTANEAELANVEVSRTGKEVKVALGNATTPAVEITIDNASFTAGATNTGSAAINTTVANKITLTAGAASDNGVFSVDVNGETFTLTQGTTFGGATAFAESDAGAAAALAALINADSDLQAGNIVATASGGTVTLTQKLVPSNVTVNSTASPTTISESNGTVTLGGTVLVGDKLTMVIEGTKVETTIAANDAYTDDVAGAVAQLAQAIKDAGIDNVSVSNITSTAFTLEKSNSVDISSTANAQSTIQSLDAAIQTVNGQRANLGAISNRLDNTVANLTNIAVNLEDGRSRIQDADFAQESANLAKQQIMLQAGTAMLAQANASQQNVLSLLG